MSQITGLKRMSALPGTTTEPYLVSVDLLDHKRNAGLNVAIYPGALGSLIDDLGGGSFYIGEVAPGFTAHTDQPVWRICFVDNSVNPLAIKYAVKPASGTRPVEFAGFSHIWDNRAALAYL